MFRHRPDLLFRAVTTCGSWFMRLSLCTKGPLIHAFHTQTVSVKSSDINGVLNCVPPPSPPAPMPFRRPLPSSSTDRLFCSNLRRAFWRNALLSRSPGSALGGRNATPRGVAPTARGNVTKGGETPRNTSPPIKLSLRRKGGHCRQELESVAWVAV